MITTSASEFNHHTPSGGRVAFAEWATAGNGDELSHEPVFRYGRPYTEAIESLRSVAASQSTVFLCNIVEHASVLTAGESRASSADLSLSYPDIETLITHPKVTGDNVDDDLLSDAIMPLLDWQVVCENLFDLSPRDAGLKEIARFTVPENDAAGEAVLLCRLEDPKLFVKF